MSWTPRLTKEAYEEKDSHIRVLRHKTNRWISVHFSPYEPMEFVTPLRLELGETFEDKVGTKVKITGYDGGLWGHLWRYTPYIVEKI